ncbi:MAG: DNA-3-methyladenine glycosylase 2 family protein [Neisseriaceae bacterium]|nr:DNA-3-methyladenine glycosylase 2 family protein [Neisseriaceae bacterium]
MMLDLIQCQQARISRDPRFDGQFFIGVLSTGIYCRTICPARLPLEKNVAYFATAAAAAAAGLRPCLRCHPDSAPWSARWQGQSATLQQALQLIQQGYLNQHSITQLSAHLGISPRYLNKLCQTHLGVSAQHYALYQKCLLAKQLLHQTRLPISTVAYASGFNDLSHFNHQFKAQLGLTPSRLRKQGEPHGQPGLNLFLSYRPPYNWAALHDFLQPRLLAPQEWLSPNAYGRTFTWQQAQGHFTATHCADKHGFRVALSLNDLQHLAPVLQNIRRVLDLDADTVTIEAHLRHACPNLPLTTGLRLPGTWSMFEAGMRAICGQQVSIKAAHGLVSHIIQLYGPIAATDASVAPGTAPYHYFPTPQQLATADFTPLATTQGRKDTLQRFVAQQLATPEAPATAWLGLKGIGPWTVDYALMRGASHPDVWLATDLGIKKNLALLPPFDPRTATPWRSYLTFHLWQTTP